MKADQICRPSAAALQVAQYVLTLSVAGPRRLFPDGDAFGDELPARRLLLLPSRDLLPPAASPATRDAVWRELIRRAREDRSAVLKPWYIVEQAGFLHGGSVGV